VNKAKIEFVARRFVSTAVHGLVANGLYACVAERRAAMQDVLDLLGLEDIHAPMPPTWLNGEYFFTLEGTGDLQAAKTDPRKGHKRASKYGDKRASLLHSDAQCMIGGGGKRATEGLKIFEALIAVINRTAVTKRVSAVTHVLTKVIERREGILDYGVLKRRRHKRWLEDVEKLARGKGASKIELVPMTRNENLCSWIEFKQALKDNAKVVHEAIIAAGLESTFIDYHSGHKGPAIRFRVPESKLAEAREV